jgi:hypothetical protein
MGWFDDNHWAGSAYDFGSGYMCQGRTTRRRRRTTSTKAQKKAKKKRIKRQKERDIQRQNERIAGKHNDKILWKVADTIIRLNNKSGSSLQSIKKVLHATAESDKWQNHLIVSALKSGTASGALINNGGRYKVATVGGKMGATKKPRNSKKRQQDEGNAAISLLLLNP